MTDNSRGTVSSRLNSIAQEAAELTDLLAVSDCVSDLRSAMYKLSGMVLVLASVVADEDAKADAALRASMDATQ